MTAQQIQFGDYVQIEHARASADTTRIYKVIGTLSSNYYVDVPVKSPAANVAHDAVVDVAACVCCGVCETEILKYRICDVDIWPVKTERQS